MRKENQKQKKKKKMMTGWIQRGRKFDLTLAIPFQREY